MRYWVGVTDRGWYERLRTASADEVNFWQPSPTPLARFLEPGTPFLFKLHAPHNFIVGGGFFVRFTSVPAKLAWETFAIRNGVASYAELRARIETYRGRVSGDPIIGCNLLASPYFFAREDWVPVPASWPLNTVRGKTMDTSEPDAERLWLAVEERALSIADSADQIRDRRYGADYLTKSRLGQGTFCLLVTDAYRRRCAISGERTLPVLEAAHIQPFALNGEHQVSNGLLLRADLHKLFDDFYLTVTPDLRIRVSPRIREEFQNGREYYRFHDQPMSSVPGEKYERPSAASLAWHNERFLA